MKKEKETNREVKLNRGTETGLKPTNLKIACASFAWKKLKYILTILPLSFLQQSWPKHVSI